jgi:hypothetical protein
MTKKEHEDYLKAVDMVCLNCVYDNDYECGCCMVRESVDYYNRHNK